MNRRVNAFAARAILASVLACGSLWWAALTLAQEGSRQYDIDIPELPLGLALQAFSQQTDLQHGYLPTDDAEERLVVGPVKGRFTASEVLARLLPAGFNFEWINARTISIISPPAHAPPGGVREAAAGKDQQRSELSPEQRLSMANGGDRSGSARGPYAFDWRATVVGKRIGSVFDSLDLDIPAAVFTRDDIDASGASTVVDLFRYVVQQPNLMPGSYLGDGTQFVDLRGLGFDSTLVLINGRRTIATASALSVNAFDINSIPLGAVDRIEIVSDSMSAIHGADAIGGVVNIVLRENIPEPRLDIDYGAADGGAVERHGAFGISGGYGRARGSIVLDYFDRGPLLGRERDRWSNQDFTRFGGSDWRSPIAAPGNVSSATLNNLPGLASSFAAIPATVAGATPTLSDFLSTAGMRNLESLSRYQSIGQAVTRKSAFARGEYEVGQPLAAYAELLYVDGELSYQLEPPALRGALVGASNPYNPFHTAVLVDALLLDLGPRTTTRRAEMIRFAGGLRGRLRNWDWDVSLQKSQDDAIAQRMGDLDPTLVSAALAASEPLVALNPFGGSGANSPTLLAALLTPPSKSRFRTEATQWVVTVRGQLAALPAGALELTAGAEWRDEQVNYDQVPPENFAGSHHRSIAAGFGELKLPVLSEAMHIPAMHSLTFMLSGRFDDYSDLGQAFNPEYALIWRPTAALALRTSLARSFRPPPLFDLYMPYSDVPITIADPARNGEFALPVWHAGGNPDLEPSSADSLSIGLRFEPKRSPAVRIAANYWRIAIDEIIAIPSAARLLATENLFPERIRRGPPSASDIAAGRPGPVQVIDITRMNFGSVRTSGVDASASVAFDARAGRFKAGLSGTWIHGYTTSNLEGMDVNRVGVANFQGTIPRWRAVASLNWTRQGIGITSAVRYVPSYDDIGFFGGRNGRRVTSQAIVDAQLSFDLGELAGQRSPWSGFELRAGAFNVFDSEPPFTEMALFTGYDATQADLRQRFAYLKLAKTF